MGVHYGKKYFKKLVIFRPHNVYGPNMGYEHVIPQFICRFKKLKNKKFKIQGNGNETRSFIFIDDFISAFDLVLRKGKHLNIYNIGTEEKIKIDLLARMISKYFNKKIIINKKKIAAGSTKKKGANTITGGRRHGNVGYFWEPTILDEVPKDADLLHNEIFGPIVPIIRFSDYEEVISEANSLSYGLASFVYTENDKLKDKMANEIEAGGGGVSWLPLSGIYFVGDIQIRLLIISGYSLPASYINLQDGFCVGF